MNMQLRNGDTLPYKEKLDLDGTNAMNTKNAPVVLVSGKIGSSFKHHLQFYICEGSGANTSLVY